MQLKIDQNHVVDDGVIPNTIKSIKEKILFSLPLNMLNYKIHHLIFPIKKNVRKDWKD